MILALGLWDMPPTNKKRMAFQMRERYRREIRQERIVK
jgi:hypothetical protein